MGWTHLFELCNPLPQSPRLNSCVGRFSLCELTTYHAHCCVNDREKLAVIGRVLQDTKACDFAHSAPGARSRCTLGECG